MGQKATASGIFGQARPGAFLSGPSPHDGGEIMRLRKAASAALAGMMVLSLAACGSSSEETTAAETQAAETTAAAEAEDTQAASEEAAEETEAPAGEGIAPEDLKVGFVFAERLKPAKGFI